MSKKKITLKDKDISAKKARKVQGAGGSGAPTKGSMNDFHFQVTASGNSAYPGFLGGVRVAAGDVD